MNKLDKARKFMKLFGSTRNQAEIYMVGGAVCSLVLGTEPSDVDFAVPYHPDGTKAILMEAGILKREIDMKEAAVGVVVVNYDGEEYEITTFRTETYSPGSRKPKVEFIGATTVGGPDNLPSPMKIDASRRDFNYNSIYWDGEYFYDPFGGLRYDERTGEIIPGKLSLEITCNKPQDELFAEDPLRVLRYIRFAAKYGASWDGLTLKGRHLALVVHLSNQTIRKELEKGFKVPGYYKRCWEMGVFELLIPFYDAKTRNWWISDYGFNPDAEPLDFWAYIARSHIARFSNISHAEDVTLIRKALRMFDFSKDDIQAIIERIEENQ